MPDSNPRIAALREFCKRQGWECNVWTGTQREPDNGIAISVRGAVLRCTSIDSLTVCVARVEQALAQLGRANSDVYLHDKHAGWGQL